MLLFVNVQFYLKPYITVVTPDGYDILICFLKRKHNSRFNPFMTLDPPTKVIKYRFIRWKCANILQSTSPTRVNSTLRLVVHGDVGRALQQSRPAVNQMHSSLLLQVLSASLQRLDEVLVRVGADHPSLQRKTLIWKGGRGIKKKRSEDSGREDSLLFSNTSFNHANQDS